MITVLLLEKRQAFLETVSAGAENLIVLEEEYRPFANLFHLRFEIIQFGYLVAQSGAGQAAEPALEVTVPRRLGVTQAVDPVGEVVPRCKCLCHVRWPQGVADDIPDFINVADTGVVEKLL